MKRFACLSLPLALLLILASLLTACAKKNNAPSELPKLASDEEVVKMWDEYKAFDGVPRFSKRCLLDGFYTAEDGAVIAAFLGVSPEDFEEYCGVLTASGFSLKEGSSVWMTQGLSGAPQFTKGSRNITVVWNMQGTLDISAELIQGG